MKSKAWGSIAARTILGACLLLFGMNELHGLLGGPQVSAEGAAFLEALRETGYLYYIIKGIEFTAGILLIAGFFVPLANLVVFPVVLNIFLFHLFLDLQGIILAVVMATCSIYLFYEYRKMFKILIKYNYQIDPNSTNEDDVVPKLKDAVGP